LQQEQPAASGEQYRYDYHQVNDYQIQFLYQSNFATGYYTVCRAGSTSQAGRGQLCRRFANLRLRSPRRGCFQRARIPPASITGLSA
jgi:hypothetical protein